MDRYAVIGNPIAHSRSPAIHAQFAQQTGQALTYEAILAPEDGFAATVQRLLTEGFQGLNVTLPFKEQAFALAAHKTARAELAGAANTLILDAQQTLLADNTDGVGLIQDLCVNLKLNLVGRTILILGAGGAVRGVLGPLLAQEPAHLHIANRTLARAQALVSHFAMHGSLSASDYANLAKRRFDVIINATSAGVTGTIPPLPDDLLETGGGCYDMFYAETETAFLRWAKTQSAAWRADGLGMLVEQAAEAFLLWRGIRPDTRPLLETRLQERR